MNIYTGESVRSVLHSVRILSVGSSSDVCRFFFFQAEDGIRDAQESRGLGDVYKRQDYRGISV